MPHLQAGTAHVDISPTGPVFLCGFPYVDRISTGIHDPLLASAIYLQHADTALLIIAVDNLFVQPAEARRWRQAVTAATAIPDHCIFISTTHTHSGPHTAYVLEWGPSPVVPDVDPAYLQQMQNGIVQAATHAKAAAQPAQLAWTSAHIDGVGCNRHDPTHGPRDPEAGILAIRHATTHRLIALSLTYCMHPTVLHQDSTLVSSDFPHYTRLHLREAYADPHLTIAYHTGPAGDQSPRYHVKAQTFAEAERLGRTLGSAIHPAIQTIPDTAWTATPTLAAQLTQVTLPQRQLPTVAQATADQACFQKRYEDLKAANAPHGILRTAECDMFGMDETLYLATAKASGHFDDVLADYDPIDVQTLRIHDTCLVGFPGELYVALGLATKALATMRCFPINLVNGELQGYIVTEEAIRQNRYEANNRTFAQPAAQILINTALTQITTLQNN